MTFYLVPLDTLKNCKLLMRKSTREIIFLCFLTYKKKTLPKNWHYGFSKNNTLRKKFSIFKKIFVQNEIFLNQVKFYMHQVKFS